MRIVHIVETKRIKKSREILEEERRSAQKPHFVDEYKIVRLKKPSYIIEVSIEEFQLINFYLEIEKREPIMNIKVDTELQGDKE